MNVTPVFVISLPRAGSTLFQRLMGLHAGISTRSEPWIAIPLFYALRKDGINSVYNHRTLSIGVNEFINSLPDGKKDYYTCAAEFLQNLYNKSSNKESRFFIDKTPRYHLIIDELLEAFPDAKFIFLWRNPLAVSASMIQTWGQGKWNLYMFLIDLYSGLESLSNAFEANSHRLLAIKYESLVTSPEVEIMKVASYLGIDIKPDMATNLEGAEIMRGDRTGQYKYNSVSTDSIDSWKTVMANPLRKSWGKKYLQWIGEDRLRIMGYEMHQLLSDLHQSPTNYHYMLSDAARIFYGKIKNKYCIEDIRSNSPWHDDIYFPKN